MKVLVSLILAWIGIRLMWASLKWYSKRSQSRIAMFLRVRGDKWARHMERGRIDGERMKAKKQKQREIDNFGVLCRGADAEAVRKLLSENIDINESYGKGKYTALHFAAGGGSPEILELLLDKGAKVDARDANGVTPLMMSAIAGNIQAVTRLIKAGADIGLKNDEGADVLECAIYGKQDKVAVLLIEHGADVKAMDKSKYTRLHIAAREGLPRAVSKMIKLGANVNALNDANATPLMFAVSENRKDVAAILLRAGSRVNIVTTNSLVMWEFALRNADDEMLHLLLESGMDLNVKASDGNTAILYAIKAALPMSKIEMLLAYGAEVDVADSKGQTPIKIALAHRKRQLARTLESAHIYRIARSTSYGPSPYWEAPSPEEENSASQGLESDSLGEAFVNESENSLPHEILGIEEGATDDQIDSAFHSQAKKYHPDVVNSLAPEFRKLAEMKMRKINWAREQLRKNRVA